MNKISKLFTYNSKSKYNFKRKKAKLHEELTENNGLNIILTNIKSNIKSNIINNYKHITQEQHSQKSFQENKFDNHHLTINHVYQYEYKDNIKVTGFGDFIRGCYYILQISDKYNLKINFHIFNHPLKTYLEYFSKKEDISQEISNEIHFFNNTNYNSLYTETNNFKIINYKYINIDNILLEFITNTTTYNQNKYIYLINHPNEQNIKEQHKEKMRELLKPTAELFNIVENTMQNMNLIKHNFIIIHIRLNDDCFNTKHLNITNKDLFNIINFIIHLKKTENDILLLTNNNHIKSIIIHKYPYIKTVFHDITHIANINTNNNIINTLKEFYIMSYAKSIYSFSVYEHGSGFSKWCSVTYDIPYKCFFLKNNII